MARKPKPDPERVDADNPEWTAKDFARAKPFSELPQSVQETLRRVRGAQKAPKKERITIRLSPDVLNSFRASGEGWQGRVDSALRQWLKRHAPETLK